MIAFGGMGLVVLISAAVFQGRAVFLFLENLVEMALAEIANLFGNCPDR